MTMQSNQAYQDVVDKLPEKRAKIYRHIVAESGEHIDPKFRGATLSELCERTSWTHNRVSARVSELADSGHIKAGGEREGQTAWVPAEPHEVETLRAARALAKTNAEVCAVTEDHVSGFAVLSIKVQTRGRKFGLGERVRVA